MFNITKKSMQWGEETLTLETGKVARQADGSVIATLGETSVMANVTFAKAPKPGRISSRSRCTTRKNTTPPARCPAASSSARRARPKRDADRAPDRPSDPPAVRAGLQERSAGDVHRSVATISSTIPTWSR
jgi:hypothetical protein